MISLTKTAYEKLVSILGDKRPSIRVEILIGGCGCGGNIPTIVFDEPTDDDVVFEDKGFKFCISKQLDSDFGDVGIDYTEPSFKVHPAHPKGLCRCFDQ